MKTSPLSILLLIVLLTSCEENSQRSTYALPPSDSLTLQPDSFLSEKDSSGLPPPTETPILICPFDAPSFQKHTGIGVMVLNTRPGDSLVFFPSPEKKGDSLILRHIEDPGWRLAVDGKEKTFISPFKWANNYEHFEFVWLEKDSSTGSQKVLLSKQDRNLWLPSDSNNACYFVPWDQYLYWQRISLYPENPIHSSPNDRSRITGYPQDFYYVLETQGPWIGIAPIDRKLPSVRMDSLKVTGWTKWFCRDSFQMRILNDLDMEGYFIP